jgi:hypothetical protein
MSADLVMPLLEILIRSPDNHPEYRGYRANFVGSQRGVSNPQAGSQVESSYEDILLAFLDGPGDVLATSSFRAGSHLA